MRALRRALLLSASLGLASSPSLADDPYADYRIPPHNWHSWSASFTAGGDHDVQEAGGHSTKADLHGSARTSYQAGFDSDPGSAAYGLQLQALGDREHLSHHAVDPFGGTDEGTASSRFADEAVAGFLGFSRYPWSWPLGLSLFSTQQLFLDQSWQSASNTSLSQPTKFVSNQNTTRGAYRTSLALEASLVWGRVRDATPVYQVQVLEERLLQLGTILRPLSPAARDRLAALYTVEGRLSFAHQRPTKYFWGELERLLRDDGVLSEAGLDAYSVQRLLEPLTLAGLPIARARGYSIGPQVELRSDQFHSSRNLVASNALYQGDSLLSSSEFAPPRDEFNHRDDFVLSGLAVNYHQPFGMRWQADGASRALVTESGARVELSTVVQGTWIVTDRWLARAFFAHAADAPGHGWDRRADVWDVEYGVTASYFFEDSWAFTLNGQQEQIRFGNDYRRSETLSVGVAFQLSGLLNAPGLFAPMRLTPPAR